MPANLATNQVTNTKGTAVLITDKCVLLNPEHSKFGGGDCNIQMAKLNVDADFRTVFTFNIQSDQSQVIDGVGNYYLRTNIHNADESLLDATIEVQQ